MPDKKHHKQSRQSASRRDQHQRPDHPPAAHSMWSGTISFGLVTIPVALFPAARHGGVSMRMLTEDGVPLSRRYVCPAEDKEVHPEHLIRGYEIDKDKFILIREEELEALEPQKSRDIDLRQFVDLHEIDPIYFEKPYFLMPATDSTKAYRLLTEIMQRSGKAGIATFVMRSKEYLAAIVAEENLLRLQTLRFHDEIRSPRMIGLPDVAEPQPRQIEAAKRIIRKLTRPDIAQSELKDEYAERLMKIAQAKERKHLDVVEVADEIESEVAADDLMAALEASLGQLRKSA